jgi:hypothetical protein
MTGKCVRVAQQQEVSLHGRPSHRRNDNAMSRWPRVACLTCSEGSTDTFGDLRAETRLMEYVYCDGCEAVFDPARLVCPACGRCPGCGSRRARGEEECPHCSVPYCTCCGRCPVCGELRYGNIQAPCSCGFPKEEQTRRLLNERGVHRPTAPPWWKFW